MQAFGYILVFVIGLVVGYAFRGKEHAAITGVGNAAKKL